MRQQREAVGDRHLESTKEIRRSGVGLEPAGEPVEVRGQTQDRSEVAVEVDEKGGLSLGRQQGRGDGHDGAANAALGRKKAQHLAHLEVRPIEGEGRATCDGGGWRR